MSRTYRRTKNVTLARRKYSDPTAAHHYIQLKYGNHGWYKKIEEIHPDDKARAKARFKSDLHPTYYYGMKELDKRYYRRRSDRIVEKAVKAGDYEGVIIPRNFYDCKWYWYD